MDPGAIGQEAFRILVERHGPMVLGLCRSLVRDQHEAEDAFQATFLVLVRKAGSIQRRDTLGPWLYGVAAKVARRARNRLNLRRNREVTLVPDIPGRAQAGADGSSTAQLVHEEISRLPDSIQKPLILCCLQGLSYDLAAQQLGVNESTLRGRLERARKKLSSRLRERGAVSSIGGPALDSIRAGLAPLPASLVESTVQFSLRWSRVTGLLGGGAVVPESVSALAQGVIQSMLVQTIRVSAVAVLAAGAIGTAVLAQQGRGRVADGGAPAVIAADAIQAEGASREQTEPQEDRAAAESRVEPTKENILDRPDGYVVYVDYETKEVMVNINRRMGARPQMRMTIFDARLPNSATAKPKGSIEVTSAGDTTSRARILKTANAIEPIRIGDIVYAALSADRPTRFALVGKIDIDRDGKDDREELKRMIEKAEGVVDFDLPPTDLGKESGELNPRIDWYVIDDRGPLRDFGPQPKPEKRVGEVVKAARLHGIRPMTIGRLLAYLGQEGNAQAPLPSETFHKPTSPARDARVRQKLDTVIDAALPARATLETLLKHIKQHTTDATYTGIPIYVDPIEVSLAKLTMPVDVPVELQKRPIRTVLDSTLRPQGLSYDVRDGFLMISSRTAILEHRVEEIDHKIDRLLEMLGRLGPAK